MLVVVGVVVSWKISSDTEAASLASYPGPPRGGSSLDPRTPICVLGFVPENPHEWNAAKCITGQPSERELMPEPDLGRYTKPISHNMVRTPLDVNRVFGCPTVRSEIPMKQFRTLVDHQNYGDEPEAVDVFNSKRLIWKLALLRVYSFLWLERIDLKLIIRCTLWELISEKGPR